MTTTATNPKKLPPQPGKLYRSTWTSELTLFPKKEKAVEHGRGRAFMNPGEIALLVSVDDVTTIEEHNYSEYTILFNDKTYIVRFSVDEWKKMLPYGNGFDSCFEQV